MSRKRQDNDNVPFLPLGGPGHSDFDAKGQGAFDSETGEKAPRKRRPKPAPYLETRPMLAGDGIGFERIREMGRNTDDTMASYDHWSFLIPEAPHWFSAGSESVEVSPPIWRYCPGGFDHQWIGMCVGKATKNAVATVCRMPKDLTWDPSRPEEFVPPLENVRLSGLWSYLQARTTHGRAGFGEGAVVAYSLDGLMKAGFLLERYWPDTRANQDAYNDRANPGAEAVNWAKSRALQSGFAVRITSRQQYLDFLAAGFPIVDGVSIGTGWMNTSEDGAFSLGGRTVGGHATVTVGYDRRRNRLYKRNSWLGWGTVVDNPEFGDDCKRRNNIGHCPLDQYLDTHLTERKLSTGETDAFVISDVPWDRGPVEPRIKLVSNSELFT